MSRFAKLFEDGDLQVLVVKEDNDDDGAPCLVLTFDIGWAVCSTKIVFKDADAGRAARDKMFAECTAENAWKARDQFIREWGGDA